MSDDTHPLLPGLDPPADSSADSPSRVPTQSRVAAESTAGLRAPEPGRPSVRVGRGPVAVERALLDGLGEWSERCRDELSLLSQPLRVIVPSRSLRDHVHAVALRDRGRPCVGVSVQTLFATALELLEGAGEPVAAGRELFSLIVRRALREEPALRAPLGGLMDAHRVVEASVNDLLDAGFGPEHAEPLLDVLEEVGEGSPASERARALVRIALVARERLADAGLAHRSQLLERARDVLEADPARFAATGVWIHGFAEATGRATDLLLAIAQARPTTLLLDEPGEPGAPERVDAGAAFGARLRERFEGLGGPASEEGSDAIVPPPAELLAAPGAEAEVRAVAGRIRALLDENPKLEPERISVVVRQPAPYAQAVRSQFGRLGIPFSGVSATVASGAGARRGSAIASLLEEREDCGSDRWVELLRGLPGWERDVSPNADLRLGLRHLGAGRLRDVARLEPPKENVRLPVRQSLKGREDDTDPRDRDPSDPPGDPTGREASKDGGPRGPIAHYRRLRREVVHEAIERAARLCRAFEAAPARASVVEWDHWLRARLTEDLGWDAAEADAATGAGNGIARGLPANLVLTREEAMELLREQLIEVDAHVPLGGRGGGVAVLGAMEARARTFDHLFVLGLNRDVFPRPIREDALLPDALRRPLLALLPDLPVKATGFDEERYLFAQLLGSSPHIVGSWQSASDDGRERVRSTFVDRLCGRVPELEPTPVPALHQLEQLAQPGPSTARERAIWAGIGASTEQYEAAFPAALREAGVAAEGREPKLELELERVASARTACVREFSRYATGKAALGPYMGFVGPATHPADLRGAERYVTSLERMADCPWKTMLEKQLRLEAPPDPLESFPELDSRMVGLAVHATLETMLGGGEPTLAWAELASAEPRNVPWPAQAAIEGWAETCAREQLATQGHPYPGLVRVLQERVIEYVARARELFDAQALAVLGAEVSGALVVQDGATAHELAFRADLVERIDGGLRLTDYKTGKPVAKNKTAKSRLGEFEKQAAKGTALQAIAYALASGRPGDVGRYLFVKPSVRLDLAQAEFRSGDPAAAPLEAAFRSAVSVLGRAWDAGVFLPRLTEVNKDEAPKRCDWCELSSACLRGDTAMRQRQRDCIDAVRAAAPGDRSELEAQHLALWDLPAATGAPAADGEEGS